MVEKVLGRQVMNSVFKTICLFICFSLVAYCGSPGFLPEKENPLDTKNSNSLLAQFGIGLSTQNLNQTAQSNGEPVSISTKYEETDYPLFLKSEYLDLVFSAPVASKFTKADLSVSSEIAGYVVIRDAIATKNDTLRILFSIDPQFSFAGSFSINVKTPTASTDFNLSDKPLNFKFPLVSLAGELTEAKSCMEASATQDGKILVIGGVSSTSVALSTVELFDPISKTSSKIGDLPVSLLYSTLVNVGNGIYYAIGGQTSNTPTLSSHFSERIIKIDLNSNTIQTVATMAQGRARHTAVKFSDSSILISGGQWSAGTDSGKVLANHEIFNIETNSVTALPVSANFTIPRLGHTSLYSPTENRVYFIQGRNRTEDVISAFIRDIFYLDLDTYNMNDTLAYPATYRTDLFALQNDAGKTILLGGTGLSGIGQTAYDTWTQGSSVINTVGFIESGKAQGSFLSWDSHQAWLSGGVSSFYTLPNIEILDTDDLKSYYVGSMLYPRKCHRSIKIANGIYTLGDPSYAGKKVEYYGY